MSDRSNSSREQEQDTASLRYKCRRALGLEDHGVSMSKEEMGDYVHWFSLLVAIVLGIVCGMVPLTGSVGIVTFLAVSRVANTKYVSTVLGQDVDELGGGMSVAMEGMAPSLATFLLTWIFMYSLNVGAL